MELIVESDGTIRMVYSEVLQLGALGDLSIRRASHVEPLDEGGWAADMSPVGGPVLGPFALRSVALAAEQHWLETHWLVPSMKSTGEANAVFAPDT